jgi:hypothetical protein
LAVYFGIVVQFLILDFNTDVIFSNFGNLLGAVTTGVLTECNVKLPNVNQAVKQCTSSNGVDIRGLSGKYQAIFNISRTGRVTLM